MRTLMFQFSEKFTLADEICRLMCCEILWSYFVCTVASCALNPFLVRYFFPQYVHIKDLIEKWMVHWSRIDSKWTTSKPKKWLQINRAQKQASSYSLLSSCCRFFLGSVIPFRYIFSSFCKNHCRKESFFEKLETTSRLVV